ncbi:hypothetical protein GQ457_07G001690 [Hibiscus cannabinus]
MSESRFALINNTRGSSSDGDSVGMEGNFSRQDKPQAPQGQPVVQVIAAPSRAPIDKLVQHRGYTFAGTIEEKPEEAEYLLERITQIVTEQLSCSDEHKLKCAVALLVDEALSWWETTTLTNPTEKVTWEFFVEEFKRKYIREQHFDERRKKFLYLKQGSEPIGQYASEFRKYHKYGSETQGESSRQRTSANLDREIKRIRNKSVPLVKVLWKNHGVEEVTWETEVTMQEQYPHLFDSGKNSRTNSLFKGREL